MIVNGASLAHRLSKPDRSLPHAHREKRASLGQKDRDGRDACRAGLDALRGASRIKSADRDHRPRLVRVISRRASRRSPPGNSPFDPPEKTVPNST